MVQGGAWAKQIDFPYPVGVASVLSWFAVLSCFYSGGTLDIKTPLNPRWTRRRAKRGVSKTERESLTETYAPGNLRVILVAPSGDTHVS